LLAGLSSAILSCSKQPNVILIMADDMGHECLASYGGISYRTPSLDRLAREGMLFTHCIAQPLCTPSRVKLMTGLRNYRNYEYFGYLDTTWLSMGNVMKEAGYRTCIAGKWQLNGLAYKDQISEWNDASRPHQFGFDKYCLWQLTRQRSEGERYADPLLETSGSGPQVHKDAYGPDIFCEFLLDFIEENRNEPFFAYYPMVLVHEPFVPTPDSRAWTEKGSRYRRDTAYFREMMSYTDKIVGKIVSKLEETGIRDRTLLIFTADNGTHRSVVSRTVERTVRGGKGNTITDGTHVPLIASWPDQIREGSIHEGLIEFSDFFPTLAELAGRNVESDGHSFLPLLKGKPYRERETVLVHYDPRWGSRVNRYRNQFVQTVDYKLYQDGSFFDLENDVMEKNPLPPDKLNENERRVYGKLREEIFRIPETPPNLLFIITDDQGYGDLSLHGNKILETPHLDSIGLKGVRLDQFHVSPVCAPTRAALLTGRRPMSTGTYYVTRGGEVMDSEEVTLAEILKDHGYNTGYFGKWHNGAHHPHHPMSQGFDKFFGFTGGHWNRYFDPDLEENGRMVRTKGYIADIFTDRAIEFIRENRSDPFLCYLAYNTPHAPFQVPDEYFNRYINRVEEEDPDLEVMNASVYGMVKNIDDNVGRLMHTLEEVQLEENTIVVFMTDNGPNTWRYNDGMKGKKAWVNDGGVRVPCFIRWKGHLPENRIIRSTSAHIDMVPTLVSMMGLDYHPDKELHGVDLTGRIYGVDRETDRLLFTHVNHGVDVEACPGAVRSADWRLTFTCGDRPELTRRSDKGEKENLADSLPLLTDSLKQEYDRWFSRFQSLEIPPIPVGVSDSVVIPAHEGFLKGNARYFRSAQGWANDWVTGMDLHGSSIRWPLDIRESAEYQCLVRYASPGGEAELKLHVNGQKLEKKVPAFVPVPDKNHNRIDRPAEAIGQSWARTSLGMLPLETGPDTLVLHASPDDAEILQCILIHLSDR